jgi:hypothetical protein
VDPGGSAQLTANLIRGAGSVENVSDRVQWSSTDINVLGVNPTGLATAAEHGEVTVRANYENRTATAKIMVIPVGTFRLDGRITEGGFPVPGVALTVVEGVGRGQAASTSENGTYALYGVAGPVALRATKAGYRERTETLEVGAHRSLDFEITLAAPRLDLRGTYDLTFEVQSCAGKLPSEARLRTYQASVRQDDQNLTVQLSGGDFIVVDNRGDRFEGTLRPDNLVVFSIGEDFFPYYYYYTTPRPGFVERLTDTESLVVIGTVTAKGSPAAISGTLMGTIGLVARTGPPFWPFSVLCHSDEHRFEMRRK